MNTKYLKISPVIAFNRVTLDKAGENVSHIPWAIRYFVWSLPTDPIIQSCKISWTELAAKMPHQNKEWGMIMSSLKSTKYYIRVRKKNWNVNLLSEFLLVCSLGETYSTLESEPKGLHWQLISWMGCLGEIKNKNNWLAYTSVTPKIFENASFYCSYHAELMIRKTTLYWR